MSETTRAAQRPDANDDAREPGTVRVSAGDMLAGIIGIGELFAPHGRLAFERDPAGGFCALWQSRPGHKYASATAADPASAASALVHEMAAAVEDKAAKSVDAMRSLGFEPARVAQLFASEAAE